MRARMQCGCTESSPWSTRTGISTSTGPSTSSTPAENAEIEARLPLPHKVSENFADHGSEFEAVTRARTGDQHVGQIRMPVDPEVLVGRVGVQAHDRSEDAAVSCRDESPYSGPHVIRLRHRDIAAQVVQGGRFAAVMERHLHAGTPVRQAVEEAVTV